MYGKNFKDVAYIVFEIMSQFGIKENTKKVSNFEHSIICYESLSLTHTMVA